MEYWTRPIKYPKLKLTKENKNGKKEKNLLSWLQAVQKDRDS